MYESDERIQNLNNKINSELLFLFNLFMGIYYLYKLFVFNEDSFVIVIFIASEIYTDLRLALQGAYLPSKFSNISSIAFSLCGMDYVVSVLNLHTNFIIIVICSIIISVLYYVLLKYLNRLFYNKLNFTDK